MQVYLISQIKLPLTRYTAIAVFVVILVIILFIIWQIIGWYSKEYILTDSKIIVKSGVFLNRKNYMPYATIQDINTSQSIFSKLFNVGSISVFSAYDNNQISIENVSNPSEVEENSHRPELPRILFFLCESPEEEGAEGYLLAEEDIH